MEKTITQARAEYQSIVGVLEMAISRFDTYHDTFIKIIVKDAQLLGRDRNNRSIVDRRVYMYSASLSRMAPQVLNSFNPNALTKKDFLEILSFFRSL